MNSLRIYPPPYDPVFLKLNPWSQHFAVHIVMGVSHRLEGGPPPKDNALKENCSS